MDEQIVLVTDDGTVTGVAPKLASHHDHTPLHLAFSCYVFNQDGQFLLTKRASVKKVWPDVWTNSACGHPGPGESFEAAIRRRLQFELGLTEITDIAVVDADYRYTTPPYNGIIENELCPIYICHTNQQPKLNPDEVDEYQWLNWDETRTFSKNEHNNPSYWFIEQIEIVNNSPLLAQYVRPELS